MFICIVLSATAGLLPCCSMVASIKACDATGATSITVCTAFAICSPTSSPPLGIGSAATTTRAAIPGFFDQELAVAVVITDAVDVVSHLASSIRAA